MHAGTNLHLTPYAVVHLLKEHGNSRSKISNVSISEIKQFNTDLISPPIKLHFDRTSKYTSLRPQFLNAVTSTIVNRAKWNVYRWSETLN